MRSKGTNSSGPGRLIRRALRVGLLAVMVGGLLLTAGTAGAEAQAHGHGAGFGGGFHGSREPGRWTAHDGGYGLGRNRAGFGRRQNQANAGGARQEQGRVRSRPSRAVRPANGGGRSLRPGCGRSGNTGPIQPRNGARPGFQPGGSVRPGEFGNARPGQEHLPQWWQSHRGLSPQQQADAMRREPGFRNLPEGQQQRLLGRLRDFDSRPPRVQQRMLNRVEMFERLSPERQQAIRGASQAFKHMPQERKQQMIRAFQQLRQMPRGEREQMLRSSYGQQFTPQERTVLGNLLSIEPYQPQAIQPYFGRH